MSYPLAHRPSNVLEARGARVAHDSRNYEPQSQRGGDVAASGVPAASYRGASSAIRSFAVFAIARPALKSKALIAAMMAMLRIGAKAT